MKYSSHGRAYSFWEISGSGALPEYYVFEAKPIGSSDYSAEVAGVGNGIAYN